MLGAQVGAGFYIIVAAWAESAALRVGDWSQRGPLADRLPARAHPAVRAGEQDWQLDLPQVPQGLQLQQLPQGGSRTVAWRRLLAGTPTT